jgi:hypothetical protein
LISIGSDEGMSTNGITTYHVNQDIAWEKMETLRLATG